MKIMKEGQKIYNTRKTKREEEEKEKQKTNAGRYWMRG
jgi:hypothetical protein